MHYINVNKLLPPINTTITIKSNTLFAPNSFCSFIRPEDADFKSPLVNRYSTRLTALRKQDCLAHEGFFNFTQRLTFKYDPLPSH
jgi:hypothetical protein